MESIVSQALIGVSYGLLLFMLAAGLTLIFSMMGVLNFAHASFYMLGAYVAYQISTWIGFWAALVLAPLVLFAIGALAVGGLKFKVESALLAELKDAGPAPCIDAAAARRRAGELLAPA